MLCPRSTRSSALEGLPTPDLCLAQARGEGLALEPRRGVVHEDRHPDLVVLLVADQLGRREVSRVSRRPSTPLASTPLADLRDAGRHGSAVKAWPTGSPPSSFRSTAVRLHDGPRVVEQHRSRRGWTPPWPGTGRALRFRASSARTRSVMSMQVPRIRHRCAGLVHDHLAVGGQVARLPRRAGTIPLDHLVGLAGRVRLLVDHP